MRKTIMCIVLAAAALAGVSLRAQETGNRVKFIVDYHYMYGFNERASGHNYTWNDADLYGNSLRLTALYDINRLFSVGGGIGVDRYEPDPTMMPIFATLRYRPLTKPALKEFYAFTDLGYSPLSNGSGTTASGVIWNLGIGWQKMLRRHFGLNFQLGYNLKSASEPDFVADGPVIREGSGHITRNSLSVGFGLVF